MARTQLSAALIVTVKDDAFALSRLLSSLQQQTRLPDEICFVVAASKDDSLEVAQQGKQAFSQVKVFPVPSSTTRSEARNLGGESTQSEIIVFTDAGCLPDQEWFENLTAPFADGYHLTSGLTLPEIHSFWDEAQARFVLVSPNEIEQHPLPATRNMALSRELWEASGGFRTQLNYAEDYEFSRRLRTAGASSLFVPEAIVFWRPRQSLRAFFVMIQKLTAGDVMAGTFRFGLISMWLRYIGFGFFFLVFITQLPLGRALAGCFALLFFYVLFKQRRWRDLSLGARAWAFPFQLVADMAVLTGSILGLAWRRATRENRTT